MTEDERKKVQQEVDDLVSGYRNQRNACADEAANLNAQLMGASRMIEDRDAKIKELEAELAQKSGNIADDDSAAALSLPSRANGHAEQAGAH